MADRTVTATSQGCVLKLLHLDGGAEASISGSTIASAKKIMLAASCVFHLHMVVPEAFRGTTTSTPHAASKPRNCGEVPQEDHGMHNPFEVLPEHSRPCI